jgi:succinate dehydrogenase hydrophobic anchor subunit
MKLLRFIKAVWKHSTYDIDFKETSKKIWTTMVFTFAFSTLIYAIGKLSLYLGIGQYIVKESARDPIVVGCIVFSALLILAAILSVLFFAYVGIKEIWKNC